MIEADGVQPSAFSLPTSQVDRDKISLSRVDDWELNVTVLQINAFKTVSQTLRS